MYAWAAGGALALLAVGVLAPWWATVTSSGDAARVGMAPGAIAQRAEAAPNHPLLVRTTASPAATIRPIETSRQRRPDSAAPAAPASPQVTQAVSQGGPESTAPQPMTPPATVAPTQRRREVTALPPRQPSWDRAPLTSEELREQLRQVPEIDTYPTVDKLRQKSIGMVPTGKNLADDVRAKTVFAVESPPEFLARVNGVLLKEARVAGLPIRTDRSSKAETNAAKTMDFLSTTLRDKGFLSAGPLRTFTTRNGPMSSSSFSVPSNAVLDSTMRNVLEINPAKAAQQARERFQKWCDENQVEKYSGALPTLLQMLQVEDEPLRQLLVRELSKVDNRAATFFLAKRALFDSSAEVRKDAIEALRKRKPETYRPVFLAGLRYPWVPAAEHAAEALVRLQDRGAVPALVRLLDKPDPRLPVRGETRELVRVNHMRNCYLCHAASTSQGDLVRGLIPRPGQPLPRLYYAGQRGDFVRADITYLRQDFSMLQTVDKAEPWPAEQRFDYLVRTRKATPEEIRQRPTGSYPQREAVLDALNGLTGFNAGTSAQDWQKFLDAGKGGPGPAQPAPNPEADLASDLLSRGFEPPGP